MVRPRRSVRGGGQAPEHLDEVEIEQGNEETLPPPPPISGEAYVGGVGPQAGVEPQVAQGPPVSGMTPLIRATVRAFQTAMAGVQGAARPQSGGNGLSSERLCHLGGVEFRGLAPERSEAGLESHHSHTRADGVYRCPQLIGHISNHAYMCSHLRITTRKLMEDEGEALIIAPVLVRPVSGKEVVMYSDASYVGLGCVLMQEGRVVAYASRQLKDSCADDGELRQTIPTEVHTSPFSMHPVSEGRTSASVRIVATIEDSEMEVREDHYGFCNGIAVDTFEEELCMGYSGPIHQVWTFSACSYHGSWEKQLPLVEFAYNNSYQASIQMAPYEALYGKRCRTPVCWAEAGQKLLPLPDILKGTTEKVKLISGQLQAASDRQKSCADLKRREVEYVVGDRVFLKVLPWKSVMRFRKKGEVESEIGSVPCHVVEEIELNLDLSYDEEPIEILASDSKVLRARTIELVKVKWRHRGVEEAT
ncbi:hypothetical protein V6N11_025699 [Hibiscus sabdariffa]|uniref:Reverse transcriptase/retrotransposon-derived protein RNase H-like domain-containing protein n=1 Tax=Hibiscus sabdariffa TaxID=183260 RepID=A0ABR2STD0_9ROSI